MMRRIVGVALCIMLWAAAAVHAAPTAAHAAPTAAVVRPHPEPQVTGPDILLGEIADVESDDAALLARLEKLSVGRAALPGQVRELHVGSIRVRLRQGGLPEKQIVIDGAEVIPVRTRHHVVDGATLVGAAKNAVGTEARLRIGSTGLVVDEEDVAVYCEVPADTFVRDGVVAVSPARWSGSVPGAVTVYVEIWVDGQQQRTVPVRCDTTVHLSVWVTEGALKRHDVLTPEVLSVERRELTTIPRGLLGAPKEALRGEPGPLVGMRTTRPLAPGTVLTDAMVESSPVVGRGQPVQIVATLHGVQVSAPGVALADGRPGDIIRVENESSGQVIRARVVDEGEVAAFVH